MKKNCKICGKEFERQYNRQLCCSKECSIVAREFNLTLEQPRLII